MNKKHHFPARVTSCLFALGFIYFHSARVSAQVPDPEKPSQYECKTEWPGVVLQITWIERIPNNRLMLVVRIQATNQTPAGGIFIGEPALIPGGPPPADKMKNNLRDYYPKAFNLNDASMKDELSGTDYPALPTFTPPGVAYFPGSTFGPIQPGEMRVLSVQFAVPPPPPTQPGQKPPQQKLSFLFPKAKGPIVDLPLPPPPAGNTTSP